MVYFTTTVNGTALEFYDINDAAKIHRRRKRGARGGQPPPQ